MIILFLLTGLTGIGLVHLQNSRDRAQRKEEAIAALESVPTITPTPVATVTAYAYPCSYSNAYASDHQRTCI